MRGSNPRPLDRLANLILLRSPPPLEEVTSGGRGLRRGVLCFFADCKVEVQRSILLEEETGGRHERNKQGQG